MRKLLSLASACALAASLGLAPTSVAYAQKGPGAAGGNVITLRVCNNTRDTPQVAVSYKPVGSDTFFNEGWFNVRPFTCEDLATTTNSYMYGYAEVEGSDVDVWQGSHPRCVEYPGPYEFYDTGSSYCQTWQEVRNFETLYAADWGVFTWNLDY